jgi:hypothetical protein
VKSKIVYWLTYAGMWLVALLPFRALYALSDGLYFLMRCSVSYSCDVSLRKLKLENCLCTGYFGSPFLPEREKEKALKYLNFRALL